MSNGFDNFIATILLFRKASKLRDDMLGFCAGIEEAHGADFAVGAKFMDI